MPTTEPITVVLAHFEDLLARGLQGVIDDDVSLRIVAADVTPARIAVVLRAHRPRVAILDVDALSVLAEVAELTRSHPETRLVLLATKPATAECAQLLAFGASACLSRRTQARDLLSAIHLASRGLQLTPRNRPDSAVIASPGSELLTRREAQVLPLLQQGRSNAEIAAVLHVAVETIRTHARNIYRKLGVGSRRELAPAFPVPRPMVAEPPPAPSVQSVPPVPSSRRWGTPSRERPRRPGSFHR